MQRQLYALQQQVSALQQQNIELKRRLKQLEQVNELSFSLSEFQYRIDEAGFVPKLVGRAHIELADQHIPEGPLFLDLEYEILFADGSRLPGGRQHILLQNGQGLLQIDLELPRFGLKHRTAELKFKPLHWFKAKPAKLNQSLAAQQTGPASPAEQPAPEQSPKPTQLALASNAEQSATQKR